MEGDECYRVHCYIRCQLTEDFAVAEYHYISHINVNINININININVLIHITASIFSRALRDSTPRYVGPSVGWSSG